MLIYIVTLFIVVLAAYLARKSRSVIMSRFLLGIAFISMVLVAGLRDRRVGTDTGAYVWYFNKIRTFADVLDKGNKIGEYGYWTLNWLVHFVSNEYMALFFVIALIVVGCYSRIIIEYSMQIELSFFIFITMGFYTAFFNTTRQAIACAIYALAIGPMMKGNFWKYAGYVLLAFLFHKTAIVTLPVYFIFNRDSTFKNNLLIILIGSVVFYFMESVLNIATSLDVRYAVYRPSGIGGGYMMVAFGCVNAILFLGFKNLIRIDRSRFDRFLNMFLFGTMIGLVSSLLSANPSGPLRLTSYFDIVIVFLWPIIFKNLSNRLRVAMGYFFVIIFIVLFVLTTERFSDLTPYIFNPSLLSK